MDRLLQDLRYALRTMARNRGFTAIAVLALALGIGANSAIFSVVNGVLLRPLPYSSPDRLVMLWEQSQRRPDRNNVISPANFMDWQREARSFAHMAAVVDQQLTLTGKGDPEQLYAQLVTADFFSVLGVPAAIGRTWTPQETLPGTENVVVLSHDLWQRRFGGDPALVGSTITLNLEPARVVGVMPRGFGFDTPATEFWMPMAFNPTIDYRKTSGRYLRAVARLNPDVTIDQAVAELKAVAKRLETMYPDDNAGWSANAVPLHEQFVGNIRPALMVLLGTVGFVLLIACVNVANLLLARSASRKREMAVRSALGAGSGRIIRQLITESLLLAAMGGGLGLLLALWGRDLLLTLAPASLPRLESISIDLRVLAFTFGVTFLTGILFGLAPALESARLNLNDALKEGGRNVTLGRRGNRMHGLLVITEVALALVLLIGAGLLLRSFGRLLAVEPGFNPENVLTAQLELPPARYKTEPEMTRFFAQVIERIKAIPGVTSASATHSLPVTGPPCVTSSHIVGKPELGGSDGLSTHVRFIHPEFFKTMQIPLLRGRALTEADRDANVNVVVVNETLAREFFPGEDPIGKRLEVDWSGPVNSEVVGVVGDVKYGGLEDDIKPMVYWPQAKEAITGMSLVMRSGLPPIELVEAVREAVKAVDPDVPLYDVMTMERRIETSVAAQRFNLLMLAIFAGVALVMASVGIYGVMAWSVSQRSHEIGVRITLGATRWEVVKLVVGQGMRLVLTGVVVGLVGAFLLSRLLESLLFQVTATDLVTYASVAALLAGVALFACYVPARRATRIDPMIALRND